jgi:hypothetical protein
LTLLSPPERFFFTFESFSFNIFIIKKYSLFYFFLTSISSRFAFRFDYVKTPFFVRNKDLSACIPMFISPFSFLPSETALGKAPHYPWHLETQPNPTNLAYVSILEPIKQCL